MDWAIGYIRAGIENYERALVVAREKYHRAWEHASVLGGGCPHDDVEFIADELMAAANEVRPGESSGDRVRRIRAAGDAAVADLTAAVKDFVAGRVEAVRALAAAEAASVEVERIQAELAAARAALTKLEGGEK